MSQCTGDRVQRHNPGGVRRHDQEQRNHQTAADVQGTLIFQSDIRI